MSDLKHDKTNNELSFVTQGIKNFQPDFEDVQFLAKWKTAAAAGEPTERENLAAFENEYWPKICLWHWCWHSPGKKMKGNL